MIIKIKVTDQHRFQSLKYQNPFNFVSIIDDIRNYIYMPEYGHFIIRFSLNNLRGEWNVTPEMIFYDDYGPECLKGHLISFVFEYIESFIEEK